MKKIIFLLSLLLCTGLTLAQQQEVPSNDIPIVIRVEYENIQLKVEKIDWNTWKADVIYASVPFDTLEEVVELKVGIFVYGFNRLEPTIDLDTIIRPKGAEINKLDSDSKKKGPLLKMTPALVRIPNEGHRYFSSSMDTNSVSGVPIPIRFSLKSGDYPKGLIDPKGGRVNFEGTLFLYIKSIPMYELIDPSAKK